MLSTIKGCVNKIIFKYEFMNVLIDVGVWLPVIKELQNNLNHYSSGQFVNIA